MPLLCHSRAVRFVAALALALGCCGLSGCIRDKVHVPVHSAQYEASPPALPAATPASDSPVPAVTWAVDKLRYDKREQRTPPGDTNHAVVEFHDDGTLADPCTPVDTRKNKLPCQLEFAEQFLRQARLKAAAEGNRLAVIVFVHGNENYAGEHSDNYPHFRQLITCLNLGEDAYRADKRYQSFLEGREKPRHGVLNCSGFHPNVSPGVPGVRFVGVYLGWRGVRNRLHIAVREPTAMAISRRPYFADALYRLRDAAKQKLPGHENIDRRALWSSDTPSVGCCWSRPRFTSTTTPLPLAIRRF